MYSLYVYNKIDSISLDHLNTLAREPHTAVMSCELDLGIQDVVERCWKELNLMRIYTKRRGAEPTFDEALIVRSNSTIEDVCDQVHRTLRDTFKCKYLVWPPLGVILTAARCSGLGRKCEACATKGWIGSPSGR